MAASRKRSDAEMLFQGHGVGHDTLSSMWLEGNRTWQMTRFRVNTARGIRLKTQVVQLRPSWVKRHPEAADWVVKVLPERRTLERDLIAAVGDIEPTYDRRALGFLDRDKDAAQQCKNFMEEWRKQTVPYQTFNEKGTEDGPYGVVVLPSELDMEGCPDFYDRLDQDAWDALDDEQRAEYQPDETDPKGRYAKRDDSGAMAPNPAYDRAKDGAPREPGKKGFQRDDKKSQDAHKAAVQRYLLKQEDGPVSIRVIPSNDCVPFLTRGTGRERWKISAMLERTLYYPEELLQKGYGWRGMGDRLLVPQGFDASRASGQNGMYYMYTLYTVWTDPKDPKRIKRPIVAYSVGGHPTWVAEPEPDDKKMPDSGVAVIDLYETHGLQGPFWWFGGGLHTSDENPDFYWEPYLWPVWETIMGIEGMSTSIKAAAATGSFTGWFHQPDAALVALDDEALIDSDTKALRRPDMPDAGEIETVVGKVFPATPTTISPDAWRDMETDLASLRENTQLDRAGSGGGQSGHAMVVKETIAQTAKRHIREASCDAVKFCGERAMMILAALEKQHGVRWPIQTTMERPVGSEMREAGDVLEWDSTWIGEGEYKLTTAYPQEYNPVKVETAMAAADRGYGSGEDVWEAMGLTDPETQRAKILKWKISTSPEYVMMQTTRLAKRQGNRLMLQVLKLQEQQRMTKQGVPGFPSGVPAVAANRGGGGGVSGGPTTAQRSLGGQMAAQTGPPMNDARAQAQVGQQGAA